MIAVSEKTRALIARGQGRPWERKTRLTICLPAHILKAIKEDADEKHVALSWLLRRLITRYLETR